MFEVTIRYARYILSTLATDGFGSINEAISHRAPLP
jgi:hypothetical protein